MSFALGILSAVAIILIVRAAMRDQRKYDFPHESERRKRADLDRLATLQRGREAQRRTFKVVNGGKQ